MAKRKSSRPNVPEEALARARAELYGAQVSQNTTAAPASDGKAVTPKKAAAPKRVVVKRAVSVEELKEEYSYVVADLRSMALLAFSLFILLVVVSLVVV